MKSRFCQASRKKVTFSYKQIPDCQEEEKIEDVEVQACFVKMEAFDNFLSIIGQNNEELVSKYSKQMLEHILNLNQLFYQNIRTPDESIYQSSISKMNNDMLVLQLQNQKLKMKEKLLKQKVQCERVLREKIKENLDIQNPQKQNKMLEKNLLKEQIQILEQIIKKKDEMQKMKKDNERKKRILKSILQTLRKNTRNEEQQLQSQINLLLMEDNTDMIFNYS